jgi:sodium/potassium-transporting ATPase subunit alpha
MNDQARQIPQIPLDRIYAWLHTHEQGLGHEEVAERLAHVGKNSIELIDRTKNLRSLARQFTNFFTILLIISAIICFIAHRINPHENMLILGIALFSVALLNALFSFIQEYRAEKAMAALKKFLPQLVEVRRENRIQQVPAEQIVPGDILLLAEGNKICADARVTRSDGLKVNNAPLTGESRPVTLVAQPVNKRLEESENIAFAGSSILRGTGEAVVFATGLRTEFGKVAHLSQTISHSLSPLERETARMIRVLTIIACCMGITFFLYGLFTGRPLWVNLVFMMGIIVANVPEGLLPTFTLSLAMGSLRMARRNVLVKNLNAVEALGSVHVICSDKTGTITRNRLSISVAAAPLNGQTIKEGKLLTFLEYGLAASEIRLAENHFLGDPLDTAIADNYDLLGGSTEQFLQSMIHTFSFDLEKKRSAGIVMRPEGPVFSVKGAFEEIRPMIARIESSAAGNESPSPSVPADGMLLDRVEETIRAMAAQGLRIIVVAHRQLPHDAIPGDFTAAEEALQDQLEHDLTLAGLLAVEDPIRPEVPESVRKCHRAGIDVILVTGDHPDTALSIAEKTGIVAVGAANSSVLTGDILERLPISELVKKLREGVKIFARTTPNQKMKIVEALQSMDLVVAMTGDGVNDAPALKIADVGIAMGLQGTDVARESAQIILLDDNFASIVDGIEEGRTVFENIKKFTNYVLVSNGPEILPFLLYILFPVPLALNVIQILSIDLGTDIIPSMGLGQEPPDQEVMNQAVNTMMPASIHLIELAGTNFWQRAPRYIPAIPPIPNKTPRSQSGATDISG